MSTATEKKTAVVPENIPAVFTGRPQWVVWKTVIRDGEPAKMPFQVDGTDAKSNDPTTWTTFAAAWDRYQRGGYEGVGYVFSHYDPFVGIDFDGCRDLGTGVISAWAKDAIEKLDSYSEVSPSGTGVKVFVEGTFPFDKGKNKKLKQFPDVGGKAAGIEMYTEKRYFTTTGHRLANLSPNVEKRSVRFLKDEFWPEKKTPQRATTVSSSSSVVDRARKYAAKLPPAISGSNGHNALYHAACVCVVDFGLSQESALDILRGYSERCEPPWSERELLHKIEDADKETGPRNRLRDARPEKWDSIEVPSYTRNGEAARQQITNAKIVGKGEDKTTVPLPMSVVVDRITSTGWPCRVDSALFVDDEKHGISWLEKGAALFGWLSRKVGAIYWHRTSGCASKEEAFAELRRTARRYEAIEELPHEPRVENHYYACQFPEPGNGEALEKYLDFFCLDTPLDRQLLTAGLATPLWGGPAGSRPALLFTSLLGRGKGKSSAAQFIGQVFGGHVDVSANEEIGKIKTRLLTPGVETIRIALLDNVKTLRLSWAELEGLITNVVVSGHKMYHGNGTRPNLLTWIITLNGASLSTDMAQRVVEVRLADPEYDGGWEERVRGFIEANRTAIIADLIAFLRRPGMPIRRHARWATWEAAVLSRVDDPNGCLDLIVERRKEADVEEEESDIISSHFASKLARLEYDTERDDVFLPNDIVAKWFNEATGDRKKVASVSRTLKQMRDEKRLRRLSPHRMGGSGERGFRWVGERTDASAAIALDIRQRIARKSEGRQDSEDW